MKSFYKNYKIFLLFSFSMLFIFTSCDYNKIIDGGGKFYEGNYTDEILFTNKADSVNIIIEQINMGIRLKNPIPYSVKAISQLVDTTKLQLFVFYGNNAPEKPKIYTEITQLNDTVYVCDPTPI